MEIVTHWQIKNVLRGTIKAIKSEAAKKGITIAQELEDKYNGK